LGSRRAGRWRGIEESSHGSLAADLPDWLYQVQPPETLRRVPTSSSPKSRSRTSSRTLPCKALKCPCQQGPSTCRSPSVRRPARGLGLGAAHRANPDARLAPWKTRRVEDGLPAPQPLPGKPVHRGYMDDCGVLRGADLERSALGRTPYAGSSSPSSRERRDLTGISPHKPVTRRLCHRGCLHRARFKFKSLPSRVSLPSSGLGTAAAAPSEATEHVITLPTISGRAISCLV